VATIGDADREMTGFMDFQGSTFVQKHWSA
jgi:hypothetical protein